MPVTALSVISSAQSTTVNIDWSAKTTGQQACIAPGTNPTTAQLSLSHANTILYTYALDVKSYQIASNDAGTVFATGTPGGAGGMPPPLDCAAYASSLKNIWDNPSLFPKDRVSVPLEATKAALEDGVVKGDIATVLLNARCSSVGPSLSPDLSNASRLVPPSLRTYQAIASNTAGTPFTVSFPYLVDNKHWNKFTLSERSRYNNETTKTALTWNCGLEDVLTLSLGTMFTTLPYRTYTAQTVPTTTGTQSVLVVNGNSNITPQGFALLNYKLFVMDKGPQPGLAFSTGPVFKFGGTPSVSNFGWFAGGSLSLWRRLYLSAGMHVGQFADYPTGFHDGSTIPPSFGQLTPVTRWSGRFGGGVSFQTNALVKSDQGKPVTPVAKP